LSYRPYDTKE